MERITAFSRGIEDRSSTRRQPLPFGTLLLNDGTGWWVFSFFWDAERPGLQIPEKYLKP